MSQEKLKDAIVFKGPYIEGEIPFTAEMVCIPSKPRYKDVDLCLKDGMNIQVGSIGGKQATFESRIALGYEVQKRWNAYSDAVEIIKDIDSWAKAYPEKVFPEPDPDKVKAVCDSLEITLDSLSAMVLRGFVKAWGDKAGSFLSKHKK